MYKKNVHNWMENDSVASLVRRKEEERENMVDKSCGGSHEF